MKILAFNASPRKDRGITDIVMNHFLESAREAGAVIEKHYVVDLNIKGCLGCFSCWMKTPGRCIQRDDMDWILPRMREADAVFYGTPIYHYNIVHHLQRMRERTLPLALPDMEIVDGETIHPAREPRKTEQHTILAAVCGFPDLSNFDQARSLFPNATHIFLPASHMLLDPEGRKQLTRFTEAVKEVGRELVDNGGISDETRSRLIVEYPDEFKRMIVERTNRWFESRISHTHGI